MAETGQYRDDHSGDFGILYFKGSRICGGSKWIRKDGCRRACPRTASVVLHGKAEDGFFTEKVNKLLPPDIRIREAGLEKNGFHARKSAVGKRYVYQIDTDEKPDVFDRRYTYHFPKKLDIAAMQQAAELLTGTHEFAAYTDKKDETSTKRTIYAIMVGGQGGRINIQYEGTGFLYHMVRILTGTLLEVGMGTRRIESVTIALEAKDRTKVGFLAPAVADYSQKSWRMDGEQQHS